jgi:lactoylglutathione lyase
MSKTERGRRKKMIVGFDHVHIICRDIEKTLKYFRDVFGGREIFRGEIRGRPLIRMNVNEVQVILVGTGPEAGQLTPGKGNGGLDHFGFKVINLEKTVEDLKIRGAKFSVNPSVSTATRAKYAFIDGPEGIQIELVERD